MAINLKLSPAYALDPAEDDMGRTWCGWSPTASAQENFEQNRGVWLLGTRAERERYATFSLEGTVRLVAAIDSIEPIAAKAEGAKPKRALLGRVLQPGDPVHDAFIGQPVDAHRNPVTYIDDPADGPRTCACNCGTPVPSHRIFVPGHDQRAVHDRITRQWGNTYRFIQWFDATYPNPDD